MILKQCENGHYYDPEKNESCPWCSMENGGELNRLDIQITPPLDNDLQQSEETCSIEPVTGWLVAVTGPHRGQDFRLVRERNFLGRGADNQICLPDDPEISRHNHCSVIYDPRSGKFVALAGESTTTRLNNVTLSSSAELHDGDVLSMGKTDLCFISFCKEGRNWK